MVFIRGMFKKIMYGFIMLKFIRSLLLNKNNEI